MDMTSSKDKWIRQFIITDIGRHRDGFTIYKVTSLIFMKKTPEIASKVSVWKRFSDFKKLYKSLGTIDKYSSIKEPFPSFVKLNYFGRFEKEVVNERRKCAIKLLEFIAKYSVLYSSDVFVKFFETSLEFDGQPYNCTQPIEFYNSSSEDDCNINYNNINSIINDSNNNNRKFIKHQSANDILFNIESIDNSILERHHVNTNYEIISKYEKHDSIVLNSKVESSKLEDSIDNNVKYDHEFMKDDTTISNEEILKIDNNDYIIVAAAHMSAGHQHKVLGEYEEAYTQYKFGITHLQLGVKVDLDPVRRTKVLEKIQKYVERTEEFYEKYLQCNISILSKPTSELENYKVVGIIDSVMLVKDTRFVDVKKIVKTVEKYTGTRGDVHHCILRQKVPFMVELHSYIETESTIFLILEYVCGEILWKFIKSHYGMKKGKSNSLDSSDLNPASCNNQFKNNYLETKNNKSKINIIDENNIFDNNSVEISNELNTEHVHLNISTNQLMEQSHELLKSVDETLKKSNSIIKKDDYLTCKSNKVNCTSKSYNTHNIKNSDFSKLSLDSMKHSYNDQINIFNVTNMCDSSNSTLASNFIADIETSEDKLFTINNNSFLSEFRDNNEIIDDKNWQIPEVVCKQWAAQLLLAIEALHHQNIIISSLRPDDLLIDQSNYIALSYVIPRRSNEFNKLQMPYAAPELFLYLPDNSINAAVDVWSFGVILYELLTGIAFDVQNPGPFYSYSNINIPHGLSENAKTLLINILKFEPSERLTIHQIKEDSFFENIDWEKLLNLRK